MSKRQLLENNYIFIEDFLTPENTKELYDVFKNDIKNYPSLFQKDPQCPKSFARYDYHWFLELLVHKAHILSELIEEPLLPTYSYSRLYQRGEELHKHKDRHSCEVSITLHLGSDGTKWPIYFTKPNGEVVSYDLKPGQAVVYLGMVSEHWRNKFKGKEYGQVFLHYVRSRRENWVYCFDKHDKDRQYV
jgi:hypothetical protein